tara:strand:+ start:198 stop:440 length:243 start_codon:yes stop_codon:yes gene_type:complete
MEAKNNIKKLSYKKTLRFGSLSIKIGNIYYFPEDIRQRVEIKPGCKRWETQGVFWSGSKWIQDTFYIDDSLKDRLLELSK